MRFDLTFSIHAGFGDPHRNHYVRKQIQPIHLCATRLGFAGSPISSFPSLLPFFLSGTRFLIMRHSFRDAFSKLLQNIVRFHKRCLAH